MAGRGNTRELDIGQEDGVEVVVKKTSKVKKIVIFLTIFIMMGAAGGGGWYWWFYIRQPSAASSMETGENINNMENVGSTTTGQNGEDSSPRIERQSNLPRSTGVVVPLPKFVVNLSDPTGKRYLRIGMEVEANSDISAQIKANSAKIRDAVIILLAGKSFADISTVEGKVTLKTEVGARLNQILGAQKIIRVYFTEFVVE